MLEGKVIIESEEEEKEEESSGEEESSDREDQLIDTTTGRVSLTIIMTRYWLMEKANNFILILCDCIY